MKYDKQFNIGNQCSRAQCDAGFGDKNAFTFIDHNFQKQHVTFNELEANSNRFANALSDLGFGENDIVVSFLPKCPETFFSFIGILKVKAIAGSLFSNFGEQALIDRLGDSGAKAVITKKSLYKKIVRIREKLPSLKYIFITDIDEHIDETVLSYRQLVNNASDVFDVPNTAPDCPSVLHYTSGSTGKPKGVQHLHRGLNTIRESAKEILQLTSDDIYWCTADQGWVTGTSYGIMGPWSLGVSQIHFGGTYDAAAWMQLLQDESVTVWYTAPTALRMLMMEDEELFKKYDLSKLKHIFSVGEPLNPEINIWAQKVLGKEIFDTWFQTETGSIMIANRPGQTIIPGSMGTPWGDINAAICDDDGNELPVRKAGNLCLKLGWDSMFAMYLNNKEVYENKFRNGFYFSGDLAYKDEKGYFYFMSRNDDIINTAGHLISPFEIESALLEMDEIAESAVIGVPDELLWEKIIAFVNLKKQFIWNEDIELKIRIYLSNKLSTIATPKEIIPLDVIPKNKSGKILRRVLKANYLGEDAGDVSTMDDQI